MRLYSLEANAGGRRVLILAVDDEPYIAELIQAVAKTRGHECIVASNCDEADVLLQTHHVDGVTLDVLMPGGDGLVWLEALAARNPALARRTLVVTAYDLTDTQTELISRCGADVMAKPFDIAGLAEALDRQLNQGP
jgi:DNA-binding response OmpR family regulator